eukprot:15407405-Heterocapsa_arctica.AAC.1
MLAHFWPVALQALRLRAARCRCPHAHHHDGTDLQASRPAWIRATRLQVPARLLAASRPACAMR